MPADAPAWSRELAAAATGGSAGAPLRIAQLCVERLGVSGAGAAVTGSAGAHVVLCATDERADLVENLQLTLGVGPCVDARAQGVAVLVPDLRRPVEVDAERWPAFLDAADAAGVRALFALPLRIGAIRLGALDLHRTEPGPMSADELRGAFMAADVMAWSLVGGGSSRAPDQDGFLPEVGGGMQVHQATGMVQAQLNVATAEALLALRARAFSEGRTVADVAKDVVARRLRFDEKEYR